jgi:hypothetical protein
LAANDLLIRIDTGNPAVAAESVLAQRYGRYGEPWPAKDVKPIKLRQMSQKTRDLIARGLKTLAQVDWNREAELLAQEWVPQKPDWSRTPVTVNGTTQNDLVQVREDV